MFVCEANGGKVIRGMIRRGNNNDAQGLVLGRKRVSIVPFEIVRTLP
jgi:hypothetical protein